MLKIIYQRLRNRSREEDGMSLVEVIIAALILVLVLVFTAVGVTSAFGISSKTENRGKAIQMINEQIAVAKQASYAQLGLTTPASGDDVSGCAPFATTFNNEQQVIVPNKYPGLDYCSKKQYSNVGITFYIETDVTYIQDGSYDSASEPVTTTNTGFVPKRVTVTVRWSESADENGNAVQSSTKMSWVRTPSIMDCIPMGLNTNPSAGSCVTAAPIAAN